MYECAVIADPESRRIEPAISAVLQPIGHYLWQARTGVRFTVVAYHLIACPAPVAASYLLVQRTPDHKRRVLGFGRVAGAPASLNLATIRQRGARLGADEVHLFALQGSAPPKVLVEEFGNEPVIPACGASSQVCAVKAPVA